MNSQTVRALRKAPGILAVESTRTKAELLLYDVIGEDTRAVDVAASIATLPSSVGSILVRINSPGGDVFDGIAIYNALLAFRGTIDVQIDGLCASVATVIAMAGRSISMSALGMIMIHNPWTVVVGQASDFRAMADRLDKIKASCILPAYARTGISSSKMSQLMDAETWFDADEAKTGGWIDSVQELETTREASAHALYDLSGFRHPPKSMAMRDEYLRLLEAL